jgi:predicted glycosyltransferase
VRIWVDLATPPQVLFFRPIVAEMERRGHQVGVTTRDFSETVSLANQFGFAHTTIGYHGGKSLIGKAIGILKRTVGLVSFAQGQGIDLTVSHNSYAQALAATALRLPFVTLMDYEHQPANHIAFRLARKVIVPEAFPDEALRRYGVPGHRVERYVGIKEDIYLADFTPDSEFLEKLGISSERIVVTLRPPATMATYHNFENPLFEKVVDYLFSSPDAYVVFLPRVAEQAESLSSRAWGRLLIPEEAVDGPNLIYHSDLVISGGGTMNREAAVLGTPVYTIFKGRMAAVDRHLIDVGRMTLIAEPEDVFKITLVKKERERTQEIPRRSHLLQEVVDAILRVG